jgi:carboxypeptidase C (cathepsin A)
MDEAVPIREAREDQPLVDQAPYGSGIADSISDTMENASVTRHSLAINGATIPYTAAAGHLVAIDPSSALPAAKIFYVAFTADDTAPSTRPITFFYNGGPGSSSVFLLLGSFGPRRIKTAMPSFTPPAPYTLEDNQDSLLDHTGLVFLNPVGTGYSASIAPNKNGDFWGVDQDARLHRRRFGRFHVAEPVPESVPGEWLLRRSDPVLADRLDIESMPLVDPRIRENLVTRYYKSGHMIYLDNESRAEMKKDLANFYQSATQPPSNAFAAGHVATAVVQSQYRRRLGKTPY